MEAMQPSGTTARRIELRLHRPALTWFARPTVVVDGRGQPAQWGTGTWAVPSGTEIRVYCFNRLWRFGAARVVVDTADGSTGYAYRAGLLPVGPGRLVPITVRA